MKFQGSPFGPKSVDTIPAEAGKVEIRLIGDLGTIKMIAENLTSHFRALGYSVMRSNFLPNRMGDPGYRVFLNIAAGEAK